MSWADGGDHQHERGDHAVEHAARAHAADGARARRMALSLGVTAAIMVAEAVGGWIAGSLALISDAGHMLTDVAALALALVAIHLGSRPADEKRTYGFRRVEVLAAQINVAALFGLVGWIGWEALARLRTPHAGIGVGLMAGVAGVGLAGNLLVLAWLRHDRSLNARSAFLHVLGDAISSVAVLGAALAIWLNPSLQWLDPALSLLIALLILWGALRLVLEITDILMEAVPRHLEAAAVCRLMEEATGVLAVHDLHIWTISSGSYALSAHLVVEAGAMGENDRILDEVKSRLRRTCGIDHTTLQIESAQYAHLYDVQSH
jgi:cobalt-zinc-cadmium efflux system protein